MKQFSKDLGRVTIVPKGKWSREQEYERLALVYNVCDNLSYVAKIDVPSGVDIENREYWQPMNATGYADNNFINLTAENENGTITAYETLEEAVATILPINRRAGATLSFYNLNSDRLDRQAEFELWQFNSTDLANWENKDYWNNIYYNWNVFVGWYIGADALKNHVKIPNVGQYAYVGSNLNDAILYQCRTNGTWTNTGTKVRNYISVVVSGNITIGENGNWFSDGEDTGIPATPAVDEQLDNIIIQLQQHATEIDKLQKQDVVLKRNIDSNFETINNKVDNIKTAIDNKIDTADTNLQNQITSNDTDIATLNTKHESLSRIVQGIAATGGASTATNVTYNNDISGLNAENAQDAIDELQSSKFNKTSILQESGDSEDKVMSQKAVSDKLSDLLTTLGLIDINPQLSNKLIDSKGVYYDSDIHRTTEPIALTTGEIIAVALKRTDAFVPSLALCNAEGTWIKNIYFPNKNIFPASSIYFYAIEDCYVLVSGIKDTFEIKKSKYQKFGLAGIYDYLETKNTAVIQITDDIYNKIAVYEKTELQDVNVKVDSFVNNNGALTSNGDFDTIVYAIPEGVNKVAIEGIEWATVVSACAYNSEEIGTDTFVKQYKFHTGFVAEFTSFIAEIPDGATHLGITRYKKGNYPDRKRYRAYKMISVTIQNLIDNTRENLLEENDNRISEISQINEKLSKITSNKVVCYGDSLTWGARATDTEGGKSFPDNLQELLGEDYTVYNYGISGATVQQIFARLGSLSAMFKEDIIVNKAAWTQTETDLVSADGNPVVFGQGMPPGVNNVTVNGINMWADWNNTTGKFKIQHINEQSEDTVIKAGDIINFKSQTENNLPYCIIIWVGTNGEYNTIDELIQRINEAISFSGSQRALVIGMYTSENVGGGHTVAGRKEEEREFALHFGNRFINVRKLLVDRGLKISGLTATDDDNTFINRGEVPPSLRGNGGDLHLNGYGYLVLAKEIYQRGQALRYW